MTPDPETRPPDAGDEKAGLLDWTLLLAIAGFVLRAPRRHRLLAATCFLAIATVPFIAFKVLPKRYEVQASILAQPNPLFLEVNQYDAPTRAARETILRRDNVVALVKQTDFVARHERTRAPAAKVKALLFERLRGRPTPEQLLEDNADAVEERLRVNVSGAGTVDLAFEWSDPDLTFDVVEAAIQSFLEARYASDVSRIAETIAILEEHATRVNHEIGTKTKEVEALEREHAATRAPRRAVSRPVRDEELGKLEARLSARRRALADLEDFRQRRIAELQAQLQQQEGIYAEQHPVLVTTRRNIEAASARSPQVDALRGEVAELEREVSRRGVRVIEAGREQPSAISGEIGTSLVPEDPRLEYERHKLWLLVRQRSGLLERIDAARVTMDTARAGFKYRYSVVTPPQLPKGPVKPKLPRLLAMGFVAAVVFAFFASAAADLWAGKLVERWEVERRLGLAVLADLRDRS